jgi:predicted amidohydrolase
MAFTIALVQFKPERKDIKKNIQKIQSLLDGVSADLIVLPELSNSGYLYPSSEALLAYSEPSNSEGNFLTALKEIAAKTKGVIVSGFSEIDHNKLYNSAVAISADGVLANYRKTHLYADEKSLFLPGDSGFHTFTWKNVTIGMMICFDWIFPESARSLALAGAQIIAHPANLVLPYCQDAMVTRSIENKVFTITANRIGAEKLGEQKLTFTGQSQITGPKGEILYRGPKNKSTVHVMSINPEKASDKSMKPKNHLFMDRRPEFYKI